MTNRESVSKATAPERKSRDSRYTAHAGFPRSLDVNPARQPRWGRGDRAEGGMES